MCIQCEVFASAQAGQRWWMYGQRSVGNSKIISLKNVKFKTTLPWFERRPIEQLSKRARSEQSDSTLPSAKRRTSIATFSNNLQPSAQQNYEPLNWLLSNRTSPWWNSPILANIHQYLHWRQHGWPSCSNWVRTTWQTIRPLWTSQNFECNCNLFSLLNTSNNPSNDKNFARNGPSQGYAFVCSSCKCAGKWTQPWWAT